eukprot:gene53588-56305_t
MVATAAADGSLDQRELTELRSVYELGESTMHDTVSDDDVRREIRRLTRHPDEDIAFGGRVSAATRPTASWA